MELVVKAGTIKRATIQTNCGRQQTNTQLFIDWMPFPSPNQQFQSSSTGLFMNMNIMRVISQNNSEMIDPIPANILSHPPQHCVIQAPIDFCTVNR